MTVRAPVVRAWDPLRVYAVAASVCVLSMFPGFLLKSGRVKAPPVVLGDMPNADGTSTARTATGPAGAFAGRRVESIRAGAGPWLPAGGAAASRAQDLLAPPVQAAYRFARPGAGEVSGRVGEIALPFGEGLGRAIQALVGTVLALSGLSAALGALDRRALSAAAALAGLGMLFEVPLREPNALAFGSAGAAVFYFLTKLASGYFGLYGLVDFLSRFPADVSTSRLARVARPAMLALAAGLAGLELYAALPGGADRLPLAAQASLLRLAFSAQSALYGVVCVAALGLLALQRRAYRSGELLPGDRRRARVVGVALAVGFTPAFLVTVVQVVWVLAFGRQLFPFLVMSLAFLPFLVVPPALAYAVLSPRVGTVGLLVKRAVLHAFAARTLRVVVLLPAAVLALHLYENRRERLDELISVRPVFLGVLVGAGALGLRFGPRLRERLDRVFFRERRDARRILQELAEKSRRTADSGELAALLASEIDAALHLESVALLVRDARSGRFAVPVSSSPDAPVPTSMSRLVTLGPDVSRAARKAAPPQALDVASELAALAASSHEPLDVDAERSAPLLARLPVSERAWLEATGVRLLVPLTASDGTLLALLALGEKLSELPFDEEDRLLLDAVAAAGALALENRLLRTSSSGSGGARAASGEVPAPPVELEAQLARSCPVCSRLWAPDTERCGEDGSVLRLGAVPHVLPGKLRFERLLGSGGMGVVYLARDLSLGRPVAVKTLPRMTTEVAARLRREARFAASLLHPNIATIFSAEAWHGTPMLVFEYLDGGTLSERIGKTPLPVGDVLRWGVALTRGLAAAHAAGVLHRDIKPSNVGFTASGTPKLLDFGLARILDDSRGEWSALSGESVSPNRLTVSDKIVGTPPYLSPEAVRGDPPEAGFDLWGLSLTLYEAIVGSNPFFSASLVDTMSAISTTSPAPASELRPDCPARVSAVFADALARDRGRRPRSADELGGRLAGCL